LGGCAPPAGGEVRQIGSESYGTVAVFQDLYGNLWDLLEHLPGIVETKPSEALEGNAKQGGPQHGGPGWS
jgi:hypothetical protein